MLDRATQRRTDPAWIARVWETARVLVVAPDDTVLVRDDALILVTSAAAPAGERVFLGLVDRQPFFAVRGRLAAPPDGAKVASYRDVGARLSPVQAEILATSVSILRWHDLNAFHGATGVPMRMRDAGWSRMAPNMPDGVVWPRTDPVAIVLIHDGLAGVDGRALLGSRPEWHPKRYSCLAGFVEPGENAEAAVVREVAEEVGVDVKNIRYVASQAWPFSSQLMLGFHAVADPDQVITIDLSELSDAQWFSRAELLSDSAPGLPSKVSIAWRLITEWLKQS